MRLMILPVIGLALGAGYLMGLGTIWKFGEPALPDRMRNVAPCLDVIGNHFTFGTCRGIFR